MADLDRDTLEGAAIEGDGDQLFVEGEVLPAADQRPPDPESLGLSLPDEPQAAMDLLLRSLEDSRQEAGAYLDDLRRVAADFDNYRKRSQREQQMMVEVAAERVVRSMLPVLDSFDAALATEANTESEEALLGGMRRTHEQLLDVLSKEGLEVIPTWGEEFDPEIHEAVMSTAAGSGRLMVARELRRGYRLGSKVIRAALVGLEDESDRPEVPIE